METLKDIFQTVSTRVSSPIFGSIFLAFIIINWQSIYILLLTDKSAIDAVDYINQEINKFSFYVVPIFAGIALGLARPFIDLYAAKVIQRAIEEKRSLNAEVEHKLVMKKLSFLEERQIKERSIEQKALERVKVDEDIANIEDKLVQETARNQLQRIRTELGPDKHKIAERYIDELRADLSQVEEKIANYVYEERTQGLSKSEEMDLERALNEKTAIRKSIENLRLQVIAGDTSEDLRNLPSA